MRVLVCGGRDYTDAGHIHQELAACRPTVIIEGGAKGADAQASNYGVLHNIKVETYVANWQLHGKAAGPIRNGEMLRVGQPDLVLAFPGGRGTADMVRQAEAAGVPVKHCTLNK